jgi:hypothetical protein
MLLAGPQADAGDGKELKGRMGCSWCEIKEIKAEADERKGRQWVCMEYCVRYRVIGGVPSAIGIGLPPYCYWRRCTQ